MKSITPELFAVMITPGAGGVVCTSANLHGETGAEFTNLSASFGAREPDMTFNTQWAHSDNDGNSIGLGMGYNSNPGPFPMTLGGKGVYLNLKDGDEGYTITAGDGAELPLSQYFTLFDEGYYSPDSIPSGVDDYVEANAGLRINILSSLNIGAGHRYIGTAGENGNHDNTLADGAYAGVNFRP